MCKVVKQYRKCCVEIQILIETVLRYLKQNICKVKNHKKHLFNSFISSEFLFTLTFYYISNLDFGLECVHRSPSLPGNCLRHRRRWRRVRPSCPPRVLNSKRSLQRRTRYRRRTLHRTARPHLITFKTCRSVQSKTLDIPSFNLGFN